MIGDSWRHLEAMRGTAVPVPRVEELRDLVAQAVEPERRPPLAPLEQLERNPLHPRLVHQVDGIDALEQAVGRAQRDDRAGGGAADRVDRHLRLLVVREVVHGDQHARGGACFVRAQRGAARECQGEAKRNARADPVLPLTGSDATGASKCTIDFINWVRSFDLQLTGYSNVVGGADQTALRRSADGNEGSAGRR